MTDYRIIYVCKSCGTKSAVLAARRVSPPLIYWVGAHATATLCAALFMRAGWVAGGHWEEPGELLWSGGVEGKDRVDVRFWVVLK